jgi:hypothetical protein
MSESIIIAMIAALAPVLTCLGLAINWFWKLSKEQGRAEQYKESSEAALKAKNVELNESKLTIEQLKEVVGEQSLKIRESERTIAFLREQVQRLTSMEANP